MAVTGGYAPRQQIYSIDECFLDFEGVRGDLEAIGRELRAAVLREVGLPTSVGFGSTKTLAKLANHVGFYCPSPNLIKPGATDIEIRLVLTSTPDDGARFSTCSVTTMELDPTRASRYYQSE